MAHLANPTYKYYFVVKAAGDNDGCNYPAGDGPAVDGNGGVADIDHFVVNNRPYHTRSEAMGVAEELSKKSPGNRYYVTKIVFGFLAPEPRVECKAYP